MRACADAAFVCANAFSRRSPLYAGLGTKGTLSFDSGNHQNPSLLYPRSPSAWQPRASSASSGAALALFRFSPLRNPHVSCSLPVAHHRKADLCAYSGSRCPLALKPLFLPIPVAMNFNHRAVNDRLVEPKPGFLLQRYKDFVLQPSCIAAVVPVVDRVPFATLARQVSPRDAGSRYVR